MTALLVLWLCGGWVMGVVGIYYSLPPPGTQPNAYEVGLWILSGTVLAVSVTILVVTLFLPPARHAAWWLL
jgi:hypothetical protein